MWRHSSGQMTCLCRKNYSSEKISVSPSCHLYIVHCPPRVFFLNGADVYRHNLTPPPLLSYRQSYDGLEKRLKEVFSERSSILHQLSKTSKELDSIKGNLQVGETQSCLKYFWHRGVSVSFFLPFPFFFSLPSIFSYCVTGTPVTLFT